MHADHAGRRDEHLFARAADASPPSPRPSPCAALRPASPVQALAQPLFTTIACARPPDAIEVLARDDDRRGHGLVGREDGRRRHGLVRGDEREIERRGPLRRRLLDAARHTGRAEAARGRHAALVDVAYHGSIPITRPRRAGRSAGVAAYRGISRSGSTIAYWSHVRNSGQLTQSVAIFSGSQTCGTIEKFCRTKNRASCVNAQSDLEAGGAAPVAQFADEPRGQADAAEVLRDDQRPHFRHARRQRRQLGARLDDAADLADHEAARVTGELRRARAAAGGLLACAR